jgi:tetratricopeptide (TPR) repeat protein
MMNKNRHLISKYLEGELDAITAARFEEDMEKDPGLRDEMDLYKQVDKALSDSEVMELRMQLHDMHEQHAYSTHSGSGKKYKSVLRISVAATLALFLGFSAINFFWIGNTQRLVDKYFQPYQVTSTNRSGDTEADKTLQIALEKYQSQQYKEAVILFEKAIENDPGKIGIQLYSGISYFEIAEYLKAVKSFTKVIEHQDNLYIEQAKWYLGLCYLKTEEKEKAIKQFRELVDSDSFYSAKAKTILKRLR